MTGKYVRSVIEVFGRPPFLPLEEHSKKALLATEKLNAALKAYFAKEPSLEVVERLGAEINGLEQEADYIKQQIRTGLSSSVKIPLDPKLLLDFLTEQDCIVNGARNAVYWMKLREYGTPGGLPPLSLEIRKGFLKLGAKVSKSIETYHSLIKKLYRLVATSFSKPQLKATFALVPEVYRLEQEVDILESKLMKLIFKEEQNLHGAGVKHLTELVELIGELADRASKAADTLQTMVIRR
ncbi:MAG: DUF47 family protein [Methanosarcinaceae archaeon]|nr:DUF47 family protein [Methanosarcinaceae archaeon]MDD4331954.1 DUF47 family protein [Methanosarcinaceae archaeon]MDD4748376.1 DUF47 family protein [Methanosarcinaceae archaeon]